MKTTLRVLVLAFAICRLGGPACPAQVSLSPRPVANISKGAGQKALGVARPHPPDHGRPRDEGSRADVLTAGLRLAHGNGLNYRQLASANTDSVQKTGSPLGASAGRTYLFRQNGISGSSAPMPRPLHRNSNPAIIGGPVGASNGKTSVLDGSRMNRKP